MLRGSRPRVAVVGLVLCGLAFGGLNGSVSTAASGATRTWVGGGSDNNWSTTGNWSAADVPDGTSEAALFTDDPVGRTKLVPNLSANVTIGQLQFSDAAPNYTLTGNGTILSLSPAANFAGVGLVAGGAGNQTIAPEVFLLSTQAWDVDGTATVTATGTIEDDSVIDYGLTKNGTGTLVLPGDVRYDGPTTVNAGSLVLSFSNTSMLSALTVNGGILRATTSGNSLGSSSTRNSITLAGGELQLANNAGQVFGSTSRITTVSGNAAIRSDRLAAGAGVNHSMGPLRIGAQTLSVTPGALVTSGTAGMTFGATTLSGNPTFNVTNSGSAKAQLTLGAVGQSGGARSLSKTGDGVLVLNGAASYTGSTTVSQGAITLGVANALGSGGLNFAGGTLNANNTTDASIGPMALTANSTLSLSPGGAAGALTFAGVSGPANGVLTISGWSGSVGGLGTNDKIVFSGGTAPTADFLQHIRFDLGDGKDHFGALGAGGELYPAGTATGSTVPNVVNLTQAAATAAINNAGLVVGTVSTAASATVAPGSVISQTPTAGASVASGSAVALVISSGAPSNITLANARSARGTTRLGSIDLSYTVPNLAGQTLLLVVYGGAECSTANLALPTGATFHGVAMNVAAQQRTPGTGVSAGAGLYWRAVSPNESGTIHLSFTGVCDERAVGAVTLAGAALTGPEAVETTTGTGNLSDQIRTLTPNALVISTATQGNSGALTATGTGHVLDMSAGLNSSRVVGGHAPAATPATRTLGFTGNINRIAMILASFPVGAAP